MRHRKLRRLDPSTRRRSPLRLTRRSETSRHGNQIARQEQARESSQNRQSRRNQTADFTHFLAGPPAPGIRRHRDSESLALR